MEKAWADLRASYDGLTEERLQQPGALGEWSLKDVLAHITTWEEEALRHLPVVLRGERPPRYASVGGLDAFNARAAERDRALSLAEILRRMDDTHARLVSYLQTLPPDALASGTRARRRLQLDTYGHYRLHAAAIREWRQRSGV